MNVMIPSPVDFSLSTLRDDDRRRLLTFFDRLRNWETDPLLAEYSRALPGEEGVRVIKANGWHVFFRIEGDTLTILDIASSETIAAFARGPAPVSPRGDRP
jgi:hypothetical protein